MKLTDFLYIPGAKPAGELSEHDQKMMRLGWDAAKSLCEKEAQEKVEEILREVEYLIRQPNTKRMRDFALNFERDWQALKQKHLEHK